MIVTDISNSNFKRIDNVFYLRPGQFVHFILLFNRHNYHRNSPKLTFSQNSYNTFSI